MSLRYARAVSTRTDRLPRTVWILGWVSYFADVASEMVYPVFPVFVKSVLGVSTAAWGGIEGLANGVVSLMRGWSGWHSDRIGRRLPHIRAGYAMSAVGKPIAGLASGAGLVLASRLIDRVGKGVRTTARDAMIADAVPPSLRGRAFGLHRALDNAGAFTGALLAIALISVFKDNLRAIFFIAFIPGVISVVITFLVRERAATPVALEAEAPSPTLPKLGFSPAYYRSLAILLVFAIGDSSDTFLLLRAADRFASFELPVWLPALPPIAASLVWTTLAYTLFNVTSLIVSYPGGLISDRIGRWPVMLLGLAIYSGVYAGFALLDIGWVWVLFAFYGIYSGLTNGVQKSLIADLAPPERKGTAMGLFYMATGFAAILASTIAGVLWDAFSPAVALGFGAGMAALSMVVALLLKPWRADHAPISAR